ncbi:MAG: Glu/Leu/Phe/Val dehydrogenase [Bacteroidia bacterium]|nr:Glu/Leu/Phe/Val dehydrogenase [Bacteroidia bacterium]
MVQMQDAVTPSVDKSQNIFQQIEKLEHEQVVFCHDKDLGLKAIIAIHDTTLGPALGGTRIWKYSDENEAIYDVLRLSRGMTFKAAISGLNLGGGKAVIIDNDNAKKDEFFWRKYGRFVDSLGGKYITAEDVGTSTKIMGYIAMETKHVTGKPEHLGGCGDPSPVTAYGTYLGMKAAAKKVWGSDSLKGKTVAIQGVGHVGAYLMDYVAKEKANIIATDISKANLEVARAKHNFKVVSPDAIYEAEMDIFAPCALGAILNENTIANLKCSVVAGAANNQLEDELHDGKRLAKKGILYAPDFLINAGGLVNCYAEVNDLNRETTMKTTEMIYDRTLEVFEFAEDNKILPQQAAMKIAEKRLQGMNKVNSK